jgi:hypothetical protein
VPVIACVRRAERLPNEPRFAAAEIAIANLEQPGTVAPLIERAAHVIYVAGAERRGLSPGAWQLEVDSLSACLELARRSDFRGRWLFIGHDNAEQASGVTWSESRWRELKREAEAAITSSGLNYFMLRTGRITEVVREEPRVSVSQQAAASPDTELPCNVAAFLLTGAALAGAAPRVQVTARLDPRGLRLHEAVQAFTRLRSDRAEHDTIGWGASQMSLERR